MKRFLLILIVLVFLGLLSGLVALRFLQPSEDERQLEALFSADETEQYEALTYWAQPGTIDDPGPLPRFFRELTRMSEVRNRLLDTDPEVLMAIGDVFGSHDQWTAQIPWVHFRWLDLRLTEKPETAAVILGELAMIHGRVPEEFEFDLLERLASAEDPDVRLAAIQHSVLDFGSEAESLVATLLDDPHPPVARGAWLLLAMLDPPYGYTARWQDAPVEVGEAMLFASAWTNPEQDGWLEPAAQTPLAEVLPYLDAIRQRNLLTAEDRGELDRILSVLPVDDPDAFATTASSGTMPAWWLSRTMEVFEGAAMLQHCEALLDHDTTRAHWMGVFAIGYHDLGTDLIADTCADDLDPIVQGYCRAGRMMAGELGPGMTTVTAKHLIDISSPDGFRLVDGLFAALASGESTTALDAALQPRAIGFRHGDEALTETARRLILPRFIPGLPLARSGNEALRAEALELDALRAWWIVHSGRLVFDSTLRRYRIDDATVEQSG